MCFLFFLLLRRELTAGGLFYYYGFSSLIARCNRVCGVKHAGCQPLAALEYPLLTQPKKNGLG